MFGRLRCERAEELQRRPSMSWEGPDPWRDEDGPLDDDSHDEEQHGA